jgi:prepilin-type processing-associated H-X9-DG protein
VLGAVSCLTCYAGLIASVPAILLGIVALRSLPRADRQARGMRSARQGIALGSIGTLLSLVFLSVYLPHLDPSVSNYRVTCQNNLKLIGVCLKMYAGENENVLPDNLGRMYPEYLSDLNWLVCPESGHKPGDPKRIEEWSDYAYVPGLQEGPADAKTVVCSEKEARHNGRRHALFLDGHVEPRP